MLTPTEREELEMLRQSAAKFMTSSLDRAFFELDSVLERDRPHRIDAVMPTSAFRVLAREVKEERREVQELKREVNELRELLHEIQNKTKA